MVSGAVLVEKRVGVPPGNPEGAVNVTSACTRSPEARTLPTTRMGGGSVQSACIGSSTVIGSAVNVGVEVPKESARGVICRPTRSGGRAAATHEFVSRSHRPDEHPESLWQRFSTNPSPLGSKLHPTATRAARTSKQVLAALRIITVAVDS
jgi:hypothetical protein